ncbi:transcriptional regulator, TetR family [Promicromonospora umidemergens]|uniref:TetR/AcrR family transcriptional regulator n=1 Tax=Promicromonospora umidemergens TaxID=629679 RepID=A0ABP8X210_9MICO|nr:TetR/AcrR family transcriptional regulator [Promicromonospora umidemergens]MCP2285520.1 transcriptional regulator, TetR family [Promicromonospora umidemergens]
MSPKLTGGATLAEHKAATREAMIDAFAVLLREVGWQDLKLQEVARSVGVARTAVYNYFPDRTALLLAWSEREMARFMELAERELSDRSDPVDRLQILAKLVLTEFSLQRGAGASVAATLPPGDRAAFFEHVAPLAALVEDLLVHGMDEGVFARADPAVTGQFIMACLETRRTALLAGEKVHTAVEQAVPFVMRALGAPEDRWAAGT